MIDLTVIILTYNEESHIKRCIDSVRNVARNIYVIDSFSTDATVAVAEEMGAIVLQNEWTTHAGQFNWALKNIEKCEWILRLDADEILDELASSSINGIEKSNFNGYEIDRSIFFMGARVRWGGVFPVSVVRVFRFSKGFAEDRLMDEHIKIEGEISNLKGNIFDISLKSLSSWVDKHNGYASLEAAEVIRCECMEVDEVSVGLNKTAMVKRYLKQRVYHRLPLFFRPILYFVYRYVLRLGFLDGVIGLKFHFFHALFYRFLVDAKIDEIKRFAKDNNVCLQQSVFQLTDIEIRCSKK